MSDKPGLTFTEKLDWLDKERAKQRIHTEIDEQGRSWAVIEDYTFDQENVTEWVGGIPDTWKRR